MTGQSLAVIAIKVWGVILVVGALTSSPSTILFATVPPATDAGAAVFRAAQIGHILNLLLQASLGIGLMLAADRIVGWVIRDGPPLAVDVYASELAALAFALVGLYAILQGAENIAATVYTVVTKPSWPTSSDTTFWYVWERERESIVRALVQIGAGLVLMFGRRAIVDAWWWLRGGAGEADGASGSTTSSAAS